MADEPNTEEGANPAGNEPGKTPDPTPDPNAGGGGGDGGSGDGAAAPSRPEGLPDQYWDDAAGLKVDALLGDFTEQKTELESLRAVKAEADVRAQRVPEAADGYAVTMPEDLELPEGMTLEINESDPLLGAAKEWAHQNGVTQETFDGLVGFYAKQRAAEMKELQGISQAELKKLGDKGPDRVRAVEIALKGRLGEEGANALIGMMFTAAQVTAIERMISGAGAPSPTNGAGAVRGVQGWGEMNPTQKFVEAHKRHAPPARR